MLLRFLILALLFAMPARAETPEQARQADALLAEGRPEAALAALGPGTPAERTNLGLLVAGIAHVKAGRSETAIPYFEELLRREPKNTRARLELAAALARTGAPVRARYQAERARGGARTPEDRSLAAGLLSQIDAGRTFHTRLGFGLLRDANPRRQTTEETIEIGGLVFVLDDAARGAPENGALLTGGLTWEPVLTRRLRGHTDLALTAKLWHGDTPSEATLRLAQGLTILGPNARRLSFGIAAEKRVIDGDAYSTAAGPWITAGTALGTKGYAFARAETQGISYDTGAEGRRDFLSLGYRHALSERVILSLGTTYEREHAPNPAFDTRTRSYTIGAERTFESGLAVGLSATRLLKDVNGTDFLFGIRREDTRDTLRLTLHHERVRIGPVAPVLSLTAERQDSTIGLYNYEGVTTSVDFTRRF